MKKLATLALPILLACAPAAAAAPPSPFGHACVPRDGVLFCPTASDAERVASFDGVPLDVDVTLPPSGDGPFPTIVMMHGWGGNKSAFQASTPEGGGGTNYHYNDNFFARQGYAVVTYSARGFGRSCGAPDSRTSPGCVSGWVRLADHRYEGRDTQYLLGLLVDQGVTQPGAIGVTGISYGGIQSHNLARLRDRVRLENGEFAPWTSPAGTPLRIAAAYPRWAASDLSYALQPNGRFLDFRGYSAGQSIRPGGVKKKSYMDALYGSGNAAGFYAPIGGPFNADITSWMQLTDRGEPVRDDALAVGRELSNYHSAVGLSGIPAPLLVENGWTDDLFPAAEALRIYRSFRNAAGARVSLQFADLGHPRGANRPEVDRVLNDEGVAFFAAHLKGEGSGPAHNAVTAFTQRCPKSAAAAGPFRARSWERLHPGEVTMGARRAQTVTSRGGNPAQAPDPIVNVDGCATVKAGRARGTAVAERRVRKPFTLLGLPTVRATIRTKGRGGFIAARLWDVHRGRQTLVSRGVYRLNDGQRGRIVFQLFGNGWRFGRGHTARLELLGNDPNFLRTSNFRFSLRVSRLAVELPVRP
jgi:fermentation-respiration switch protein FrsA (DUF1100 family)